MVLAKKVPVIAGEEGIARGCGVATLSISYYDLGYQTGQMAYDILANGADVSTMAVQYRSQCDQEVQRRQLPRHWASPFPTTTRPLPRTDPTALIQTSKQRKRTFLFRCFLL